MSDPSPREQAEAIFGHVQKGAGEMIAAARDALDLLDGIVKSADLAAVLDTLSHLGQSVLKRPRPETARREEDRPPRSVQRISVR